MNRFLVFIACLTLLSVAVAHDYTYRGEGHMMITPHGTGPWGIEYINPEDDPRN
jgi:hypothetical protein